MKNKKGFTLVELLAVIVVLAIVMLVVADRVGDAMLKSRGNSLALQVKSLNREVEKVGAMENQITTKQIDKIVTDGDLTYLGYIKAGTGNFDNDVIVVQAKKGSKFSNIAFTNDMNDLGTFIVSTDPNSVTLGNNTVRNSKAWLREPILYFKTTVPIDDTTLVDGIINFTIVNPTTDIPEDGKGTEGGDQPVNPEKPAKTYKVGEEVSIGTENFNVIKDNGDSVTMFAKNVLDRNTITQTKSVDWENVYGIIFTNRDEKHKTSQDYYGSHLGYWTDDKGYLLPEYGGDPLKEDIWYGYPVYAYDKNSDIFNIVTKYVDKLKNIKNILNKNNDSLTGRLINIAEIEELGYSINDSDYCTNPDNEKWLVNGQNWWMGFVGPYYDVYVVDEDGYFNSSNFYSNLYGVRPVITIDKKYL